jgi:hypothetical protein
MAFRLSQGRMGWHFGVRRAIQDPMRLDTCRRDEGERQTCIELYITFST